MTDLVLLEVDGNVGVIRLNRPPVNAINSAVHAGLAAAAAGVAANPAIRAVVLYGGERAFAAGADIAEMAELDPAGIAEFGGGLTGALDDIAAIGVPTVAAVTGYALGGGCELALACDLRIVAEDARLGLPEITLGVIPGAGGTQRLPRLVGSAKAKELIFTGRPVTGAEAVRIGLATKAVAAGEVYTEAMTLARRLAAGATMALRAAKRAIDGGLQETLPDGLRREGVEFAGLFATEDQKTGMRSFLSDGPGKATFEGR